MKQFGDLQRAEDRRAGLVASSIYNVNRKKGARVLTPDDFVAGARPKRRHMTPAEADVVVTNWVAGQNARAAEEQRRRSA